MTRLIKLLLTSCVALLFLKNSIIAARAEIYVIAHPGFNVPAEQLDKIFKGEITRISSQRLTLIDNEATLNDFSSKVLSMSGEEYLSYWVKKNFSEGIRIPKSKANDAAVFETIENTPNSIGYVSTPPGSKFQLIRKY